jgi:hypothetical protein
VQSSKLDSSTDSDVEDLLWFIQNSIALYGAETWTLRAVDQKHLESFEM